MAANNDADKADETGAHAAKAPRYIRFEVSDFNCKALCKIVPARHKDDAVCLYSGAFGLGPRGEILTIPDEIMALGCPNAKLTPDWSTLQTLPWASVGGEAVQRVHCDMTDPAARPRAPLQAAPRVMCARLLGELGAMGIDVLAASELEFAVAEPAPHGSPGTFSGWKPIFDGFEIFATLQNTKAMDYMAEVEKSMEQVGVDIKTMNVEYGPGVLEITFAPTWNLAAADDAHTFRTGVKEIAQRRGLLATFLSKPFGLNGPGNGGHFNFSLWSAAEPGGPAMSAGEEAAVGFDVGGRRNLLHSPDPSTGGLSETGAHFLAGILAHVRSLDAICSPTPACYVRHGRWAPSHADWGFDDRTAALRVKTSPKGRPSSCFVEFRMPSASASPYLVLAGIVAAGLDGLRRKLPLPPAKRAAGGGGGDDSGAPPPAQLPGDLASALQALREDKVIVDALGEQFVRWYCLLKEGELKWLRDRGSKEGGGAKPDDAWRELYAEYV